MLHLQLQEVLVLHLQLQEISSSPTISGELQELQEE